jgi:hypothetical protein
VLFIGRLDRRIRQVETVQVIRQMPISHVKSNSVTVDLTSWGTEKDQRLEQPIKVDGLLRYIKSWTPEELKDPILFLSTTMVTYTTSNGAPVSEPYAAQRAGINGPLLLQGMHASYPP